MLPSQAVREVLREMEPTTTIKASVPSTQIDQLNPSWQEGLCLVGTRQFPSFASKGSFPCVVLRFPQG